MTSAVSVFPSTKKIYYKSVRRIRRTVRHFWTGSLRQKLTVLLFFLIFLPLVGFASILIYNSQSAVKSSVLRDRQEFVKRAANEIELMVHTPLELLENSAAILGTLGNDSWRHETVLVEMALNQEVFGRIASVELAGKEIATSQLGSPLRDRGSEAAFRQALTGTPYVSDVFISEADLPFVKMAVPIFHFGKVEGVIIADVSIRGIWDKIDEIKIADTGHVYIVDDAGNLIAHRDKKRIFRRENVSDYAFIHQLRQGKTGALESKNREVISAFAPVPGLAWGIVLEQKTEEAFSFAHTIIGQGLALVLTCAILVLFVSAAMATQLVRPISRLVERIGSAYRMHSGSGARLSNRMDELVILSRSFNDMAERLKESQQDEHMAILGRATAGIAHELKNGLIMANTLIKLFPKRYEDEEFVKKFSRIVPKELDDWNSMLKQLSDYTKMGTSSENGLISVNRVIDDFLLLIEEKLREHGTSIKVEVEPELPQIKATDLKLKQVLINLTMNALDAMPEGGTLSLVAKKIQLGEGLLATDYVEIAVSDTGCGLSEKAQEKLFTPYQTTKSHGWGVGLSISKSIIESYSGTLSIQNRPERGTVAHIRIPVM